MYANLTRVRTLAKNRKSSLQAAEIEALAVDVDARLDAELSGTFKNWPVSPVPAIVETVATYLTAAALEYESYAQRNADGIPMTSLASLYEKKGNKMLQEVLDGKYHALDAILQRPVPIEARPAPCPPPSGSNPCRR